MRILEHEQGTDEWLAARIGIPTASIFRDIFTSQGKRAASMEKVIHTLAAEKFMGRSAESFESDWMRRGTELEPQARELYAFLSGEVEQVGLCLLDDGSAGASPDGLTSDGGLEIKCPAPHTHVEYLRKEKIPATYIPQVQGQMWICERDHWDFMSYHPDMPPLLARVDRDEKYIAGLSEAVKEVSERILETVELIKRKAA